MLVATSSGALAVPAADPLAPTKAAAATGDVEAEFALAEAYRTGKGVAADHDKAVMWYKRAAALGHVQASDTVGFLLFTAGQRSEAMPYIEKAAARGDPRAFYLLGTAHFNGDYATRDWPLGYAQMSRAAEAGLTAAKKSLIVMDKYLLAADRARADAILTTLPPVRHLAPPPTPAMPLPPVPVTGPALASGAAAPPVVPVAKPTPAPAPLRGRWRIQLGAYATAARARSDWMRLAARLPALGRLDQAIVAVGAVQRLQAAGIADRAAAETMCRQVRATGGACFLIAP